VKNITPQSVSQRFSGVISLMSQHGGEHVASLMHTAAFPEDYAEAENAYDAECASVFGFSASERSKPFMFSEGIAYIPVQGALLHRYGWSYSGATGYDYVRSMLVAALDDAEVKGIVFDINSPGGQVAGNFELADQIYAARGRKPMMAMVDAMAASGGYSLASAAGRVVATPSAMVGSIGVGIMHVSYAKAMKESGIEINYVYAGKQKVEGSPYLPLSEAARERMQERVDSQYEKFVGLVARNRSLDPEVVRKTEAGMFDAEDAQALGLVDAVSTPMAALAAFRDELSGSQSFARSENMSIENKPGAEVSATPATQDNTAAITAERARIGAIMAHPESAGRESLASHLALKTSMSVEDAAAMLAAAPKAEAKPATASTSAAAFDAAMESTGNPNVGAGQDAAASAEPDLAASILASYNLATGVKPRATH